MIMCALKFSLQKHTYVAQFRTQPFPHYEKLHTIFCKDIAKHHQADGLGGDDEGITEENEINPCLEAKDLHVSGNVSSFYEYREKFRAALFENLEEVANERINASNEMMDKVMNLLNDLYGLTEDECLKAMSVIVKSAPLFHMFDRLDEDGKVRMA
ncbi:hypothetical protein Tco_1440991 [Tanacetum coccineum]